MSIYVGGEFQILSAVNGGPKALALNGATSLEVAGSNGWPESRKELLWSFVPLFGKEDFLFKGIGIRNSGNGKFIRGNSDMPDGGGVSVVEEKDLDDWAGWGFGTDPEGAGGRYVPLILNKAPGICVMTLYGASGWGPGTQVITYRWSAGTSQLWFPLRNSPD